MPDGTTPDTNTQPINVSIPNEWATQDAFKGFFSETDGEAGAKVRSFDLAGLSKAYTDATSKIAALPAVPKTADEYKFEFPQDFPTESFAAEFKARQAFALQAGMTADQFSQLMSHDLGILSEKVKAHEAERTAAHDALKAEWGSKYAENIAAAKKAIVAVFGEKIAQMYDPENDTHPDIIRGMFTIAKGLKEDVVKPGGAPPATGPAGQDTRPRDTLGRPVINYPYMKKAS